MLLFLVGLLFVGLCIFRDYGVHWDEMHNQVHGKTWARYARDAVTPGRTAERPTPDLHDMTHGPAFQMFLATAVRVLDLRDSRTEILTRHLLTFLTYWFGVCVFLALCARFFESWNYGLLACTFLVAHPRVFANAFYNSVDVPFMAFYVVATWTMLRFIEKRTIRAAVMHAVACGILVDIRVAGAIVPFTTFLLSAADVLAAGRSDVSTVRRIGVASVVFGAVFTVVMAAFWPLLWHQPVRMLAEALRLSILELPSGEHWEGNVYWILTTTPPLVTCFFAVGLVATVLSITRRPRWPQVRGITAILLLLLVPLIVPALLGSKLFDDWRHHFFVYPLLVMIAIAGVRYCLERGRAVRVTITAAICLGLASTAWVMVDLHPHQAVYGSILAGSDLRRAKVDEALDFWGLSYRSALEYVLEQDPAAEVPVSVANGPGGHNVLILEPAQRKRLAIVEPGRARYLLTNFRSPPLPAGAFDGDEVYALRYKGQKYMAVYKARGR